MTNGAYKFLSFQCGSPNSETLLVAERFSWEAFKAFDAKSLGALVGRGQDAVLRDYFHGIRPPGSGMRAC